MLYQRVSSSCIAQVGYNPANQILAVRFHDNDEYWYTGVSPETYRALLAATSIGRFFNAHVRDSYALTSGRARGAEPSSIPVTASP